MTTSLDLAALSGLTAAEAHWIDYVKAHVVGLLDGNADQRAETAAIVTWWALKEGVLDVRPNPWRHNLCGTGPLGDLDVCGSSVWQIGMSGIQPSAVTEAKVESVAQAIYPGVILPDILERIASDAGVTDGGTVQAIADSTGSLRKAWLLRDPAISFTLQAPFVEMQCIRGSASWCFGGWAQAKRFASDHARIDEVVSALTDYYADAPAPSSLSSSLSSLTAMAPTLAAVAAAGVFAWWVLYETAPGSRLRRRVLA